MGSVDNMQSGVGVPILFYNNLVINLTKIKSSKVLLLDISKYFKAKSSEILLGRHLKRCMAMHGYMKQELYSMYGCRSFLLCNFNPLYAGKFSHEFSFFQNSDQRGKQFRFRSGPVKRRPRSMSKLLANVINRHQWHANSLATVLYRSQSRI